MGWSTISHVIADTHPPLSDLIIIAGLVIGFPPIVQYGTKALKDRVIPEILSGKKRLCLAITEPTFGSDVKRIACTATKTPDGK